MCKYAFYESAEGLFCGHPTSATLSHRKYLKPQTHFNEGMIVSFPYIHILEGVQKKWNYIPMKINTCFEHQLLFVIRKACFCLILPCLRWWHLLRVCQTSISFVSWRIHCFDWETESMWNSYESVGLRCRPAPTEWWGRWQWPRKETQQVFNWNLWTFEVTFILSNIIFIWNATGFDFWMCRHEDQEEGKLFVGGLSWETTQDTLLRYFSRFPPISLH